MAKKRSTKDPHAKREAANYSDPIASREFIIALLTEAGVPLSREDIAQQLGIQSEEAIEALRRRLRAMERDGQLMYNRRGSYGLIDKMQLVRGRVQGHRDGYGFVISPDSKEDLFLHAKQMAQVFDGDEVLVRPDSTDRRGRTEGVIVEVLSRNTTQLVGRLYRNGPVCFVVPDNSRISQDIHIAPGEEKGAEDGQFVMVDITSAPGKHRPPIGAVSEILGDNLAPGLETDVAVRSHGIPHEFSAAVLKESAKLGDSVAESDKDKRIDLRDFPLVTIDGEDARDFDDAVCCIPREDGGWQLWVAIADVSHYVKVGSELDKEAWLRGTSVYFPNRVVPMLPEAISNGLCSINPDVDRLCMVCEMDVSSEGVVEDYRFMEGLMRSHARLTYNQVAAMLAGDENPRQQGVREFRKDLLGPIEDLYALFRAFRVARAKRGALEIESTETSMLFNEEGKISRIVPVVRNDAHKLIEECMLAANVCAADFLAHHKMGGLYRVHQSPKAEKVAALRDYLGELALTLPGGDKPSTGDYQSVLAQAADRPDAHVVQSMVLRSMNQAMYQPDNNGHFGLNYEGYTHFTSPIRRYPDLMTHRAIRSVIRSRRNSDKVVRAGGNSLPKAKIYPYSDAELVTAGEHCSMTERRADDASRDVVAWLKCEYLSDRVGEEFEGIVTAVTGFGLFVELVDIYVEGLVHITALDNDYYNFDQAKQRLIGERTRAVWQLGDSMTVRVVRVDLDDRKIDLEPVGKTQSAKDVTGKKPKSGVRDSLRKGHFPGNDGKPKKGKSAAAPKTKGAGKKKTKPRKRPKKT
ncbi:MAG: ribonuclease R [Pseudomonadales bacterium]